MCWCRDVRNRSSKRVRISPHFYDCSGEFIGSFKIAHRFHEISFRPSETILFFLFLFFFRLGKGSVPGIFAALRNYWTNWKRSEQRNYSNVSNLQWKKRISFLQGKMKGSVFLSVFLSNRYVSLSPHEGVLISVEDRYVTRFEIAAQWNSAGRNRRGMLM